VRRQPPDEHLVCLAATDPANLLGTLLPGAKVARVAGSRVLYRGGVPIATSVSGQVELLAALSPGDERAAVRALALDPNLRLLEMESAAEA
jgi:ATP-dependent Lhr-like helicase